MLLRLRRIELGGIGAVGVGGVGLDDDDDVLSLAGGGGVRAGLLRELNCLLRLLLRGGRGGSCRFGRVQSRLLSGVLARGLTDRPGGNSGL
jgi:hypothetical protein